ncbi:MAG: ABC transporter ATP-binding protein [Proteobacteria bacterium]|nr:ABC transporter ATP-binding protein [Pseudomonadota bacterium]
MELLKFEKVGMSFKRKRKPPFWAIKDANFSLMEGETLGIVGSNGSGKSTLLRIIADIYQADRGTITRKTSSCALLTLQLGFVPYLNGYDNLILSGMLQGLTKQTIVARIPTILTFAELGAMIDEPINTWSTGMVARLGFGLALEIKPKILLIDETLGVGDEAFRKKSTHEIKKRIKSNQTVVLVSHNSATITELCDRLVWIEKGETLAQGGTAKILAQYKAHTIKVATQS